jgi:uncharacterized RDD family membrane protein YckC
MNSPIHFETPENVQISYEPAGLGTRYIAWLLDAILVFCVTMALVIILFCAGVVTETALSDLAERQSDSADEQSRMFAMYFFGVAVLCWAFSSVIYFSMSELLMRGQTIGKRVLKVRVVKVNGFALDPMSILVRNIFRAVDEMPWLWIVPVLSRRRQRFGDMVAGTVVISEAPQRILRVREELAGRTAVDARYRFDHAALGRLRPVDITAVEQLVDRWDDVPGAQLVSLLDMMIDPLSERLKVEPPPVADRLQFLEDLLAAEYRRQSRSLA